MLKEMGRSAQRYTVAIEKIGEKFVQNGKNLGSTSPSNFGYSPPTAVTTDFLSDFFVVLRRRYFCRRK